MSLLAATLESPEEILIELRTRYVYIRVYCLVFPLVTRNVMM